MICVLKKINLDIANLYMRRQPEKTLVKWLINGHISYPVKIMGLVMKKIIGGDLQTGLENLKRIKEK